MENKVDKVLEEYACSTWGTGELDGTNRDTVKSAIYEMIEDRVRGKRYTEVIMSGEKFVPLSDVLSAMKEIFDA